MEGYGLILCTLLVLLGACHAQIGNTCVLQNTGGQGNCKQITDCPAALAGLQYQIFPQTCGYIGTVPIVCCDDSNGGGTTTSKPSKTTKRTSRPTSATQRTTSKPVETWPPNLPVGEKSLRKCRDYGNHVYEWQTVSFVPGSDEKNVSVCGVASVPLIVGGEPARPKEFPHQALLGYGDKSKIIWQCGGSLISEQYVLTAGHCTNSQTDGAVKYIRLGDLIIDANNEDASPVEFDIIETIRHPEYKPPAQYNDIALLKMDRPVKLNKWIRPACLQTTYKIDTRTKGSNPRYIATGWGLTSYVGERSTALLKVVLDNFSQEQCNMTYKSTSKRRLQYGIVPDSQLCAGGTDSEKDTCQGDSGGPLQVYHQKVYCMYNLVGVTSFGKSCGIQNIPGVYTRVSHYINWIENIVWPTGSPI